MDTRNRRTLIANAVRALVAIIITNALGYLFYWLLLHFNSKDGTIVYSFAVFLFSIYIFIRIITLPTKDERKISEREEMVKLQVENGYRINFKSYFIKQLKFRLPSVFAVVFLSQIPLIVNYAMVSMAEGFTIYTSPISIYKFSTMSLFVWEILGNAWWLAPVLFTLVFAVLFTAALWFYEKSWIVPKPSWVE